MHKTMRRPLGSNYRVSVTGLLYLALASFGANSEYRARPVLSTRLHLLTVFFLEPFSLAVVEAFFVLSLSYVLFWPYLVVSQKMSFSKLGLTLGRERNLSWVQTACVSKRRRKHFATFGVTLRVGPSDLVPTTPGFTAFFGTS